MAYQTLDEIKKQYTIEYGIPKNMANLNKLLYDSFDVSAYHAEDSTRHHQFVEFITIWCPKTESELAELKKKSWWSCCSCDPFDSDYMDQKRNLVAMCCIYQEPHPEYKTTHTLYSVAVDNRYRKQGYGKKIVELAYKKNPNIFGYVIDGRTDTEGLLQFYKKCGIEHVGKGLFGEKPAYLFAKTA